MLFDAGPTDSRFDGIPLINSMSYQPARGFGWLAPPGKEFNRRELSRSRSQLTRSGVSGRRMKFRADVLPGTWHVLLWLEAERPGTAPPRISLQNKPQETGWHRFAADNEPRSSPEKTYRVFAGALEVKADGAIIELQGADEGARLLGISLIKHADPATPAQTALVDPLKAAGGLRSATPMSDLLRNADELLKQSPDDPLLHLQRQRIELLAEAERLMALRGWEASDQLTDLGFSDRLTQAIMLLDGLLGADDKEAGELTDRALFLRGRLLYWLGKERGEPSDVADAERDLAALFRKHPSDDLLAMYNGKRIQAPVACRQSLPPAVPAWSVAQHEALCRLRAIIGWWVNERQAASGEFGGKFDDDVELLRWWSPLALAGDETARRGWRRLADGVWQSKQIEQGYARKLRDVEHAAELIADTAPLMAVYHDDAQYVERLRPSADHFRTLWTGVTPAGHRFFRSAWFTASEIDASEPRNRDVEYNARAARALRYLAWRRGDSEVVELLHEWSLAWVDAAMRTDKGKPRGVIPPSVRFADEALNGDEPTWYAANMGWDYYDWEFNAGSSMLDQLLFTYTLTKDEQLLKPMAAALELIRAYDGKGRGEERPETGSPAWAAAVLADNRMFWSVVQQWRFASGDARWDDLIRRHGAAYGRYRVTGDRSHLLEGLQQVLEQLRYNKPMLTTEVLFTDRVYVPGWECLKAMLTGDGMPENASPYFAVTWEKTGDGFTALVSENTAAELEVELFSHDALDRDVVMRLWNLKSGDYTMTSTVAGASTASRSLRVEGKGQRVSLHLPAKQLLKVKFVPAPPVEPQTR